jgi:hypothetical protein
MSATSTVGSFMGSFYGDTADRLPERGKAAGSPKDWRRLANAVDRCRYFAVVSKSPCPNKI